MDLPPDDLTDESFATTLAAARAGAEWAWRALYRDLAPPLLRYLRARGAVDPEDVLGAAMLDLVRALPRFSGGRGELRTFAFTIAQRRLVDDRRRQRRRPTRPAPPDDLEQHMPHADGEAEALEPLLDADVRRLLDTLTGDQRDVVLLRVLIGMSVGETALVMGRSQGAVKTLQNRAFARLRRAISRNFTGTGDD